MAEQTFPTFTLCPCGKHGRIQYDHEHYDGEVYSQKFAVKFAWAAIHAGRIPWGKNLVGHIKALIDGFKLGFEVGMAALPENEDNLDVDVSAIWQWNNELERQQCKAPHPPKCFLRADVAQAPIATLRAMP